jgi:molecular chaperone DnaK
MNSARERLTQASHKLAEAMYKSSQAQPGATPGAGPTEATPGAGPTAGADGSNGAAGQQQKKDEGVIDAEYVDVDEKK